jgi:two-component sensor histidine kinase
MAIEFRKSGISVVGDIPWGTHFCHFYETKQELLDTLVPYFTAGLEGKEYCMWVVTAPELITAEEAKEALAKAVPDLGRHLSESNIEILNWSDWYLEDDAFNWRVTSAWNARLKGALAKGYDGIRISGDTFWLGEKHWKDFCAYEKQLDDSISDQPMTVLCTYPFSRSGADIFDVVRTHRFAIAKRQGEWNVIKTPELIGARAEIKRLNGELRASLSSLRWDLEDVDEAISESGDPLLQGIRKKIEAMMRLTDTTINIVRRVSSELRPIALDALGLTEAIEWQARQFQERSGIIVQCDCAPEKVDLTREQSTAIFRIFQEALTNILRHAQATRVNIQVNDEDNEFILTIEDNGRGITDYEKSGQRTLGLLGMRERAYLIGGNFDITGFPGNGTVVTVRVNHEPKGYSVGSN